MIEIIKRGSVKVNKRKFFCDYCNTIFTAEETDYETLVNTNRGIALGEVTARCSCPVCQKPCYTSRPYEAPAGVYDHNRKDSLTIPIPVAQLELGIEQTEGAE